MTLRKKILLTATLTVLLPFAAVSVALTLQPIQQLGSSGGLKALAVTAAEIYRRREGKVLEAALFAAQSVAASGLVEELEIPKSITGAASPTPTEATKNDNLARGGFSSLAANLITNYGVDFVVLTNTQGRLLARTGGRSEKEENFKDNLLISALVNSRSPIKSIVSSNEEKQAILKQVLNDQNKVKFVAEAKSGESGLTIEAIAPVLLSGGRPNAFILVGKLINAKDAAASVANDLKKELQANFPQGQAADISIAFKGNAIASTMDNAVGAVFSQNLAQNLAPSVYPLQIGGRRYLAGVSPIRGQLNDTVIAQIIVTEPQNFWRNLLQNIGAPSLVGLGASWLLTLLFLFILIGRISRDTRRLNSNMQRIALGDFNQPVDLLSRRDEIGQLADSLEKLRATVKEAIERLRRRLG